MGFGLITEDETSLFINFFRKPKTQKGKRIIEKREAKIVEDIKSAIIVRGGRTSEIVADALKNIVRILKSSSCLPTMIESWHKCMKP